MRKGVGVLILILISTSLLFFSSRREATTHPPQASHPADAGCLKCHEGIEQISDGPLMSTLTCAQCHRGDPTGTTKKEAHKGMFANPSDLRVVDHTCRMCHPGEVENAKKSLHATSAGKISGSRYANAAQKTRNAMYATTTWRIRTETCPKGKGR